MNAVKYKAPFVMKGQVLPATLIEKKLNEKEICCKKIINCIENQIQSCNKNNQKCLLNDCFIKNKRKKIKNQDLKQFKKNNTNKMSVNQKQIYDFHDEIHSCPICLEKAIEKDIDNNIISNRKSCYLNNKHYFFVNDDYFKKYQDTIKLHNRQNVANFTSLKNKNINITFALLFGDSSNFDFKSTNETGMYSRYNKNFSNKESNYNLNVIVTSM